MTNPAHTTRDFWKCFQEVAAGCESVLEVGCGNGSNLRRLNITRRVGIEIYEEYLRQAETRNAGIEFHIGDARTLLPACADHSFDLVLLIDVLEHFPKTDGLAVLVECARIASKRILLWVPEGRCVQDAAHYTSQRLEYNPHQDHLSEWRRKELAALGFDVAAWGKYHVDKSKEDGKKSIPALFCVKNK